MRAIDATDIKRHGSDACERSDDDQIDDDPIIVIDRRLQRLFTPEKKDEALKKTTAAIKQLEPLIEASGGPFCMGKEAHYADMHIFHHTSLALMLDGALLKDFPKTEALMAAVADLDGVKEYLAERPALIGVDENSDRKLVIDGVPHQTGFMPKP